MAHDPFRDQTEGLRVQLRETHAFIEATERGFTREFWEPLGAQLWLAPPSPWTEPPEDAGADVLMAAQLVAEKRAAALRDVVARWAELEPLWTHAPRELTTRVALRLDKIFDDSSLPSEREWLRSVLAKTLQAPAGLPAELSAGGDTVRERDAPLFVALSTVHTSDGRSHDDAIYTVLATTVAAGLPAFEVNARGFFEGGLHSIGLGRGDDVGDEDFDGALHLSPSNAVTRAVLDATLRKALVDLAATSALQLTVDPPIARLQLEGHLELSVLRHALDVLVALHRSHAVPPLRR